MNELDPNPSRRHFIGTLGSALGLGLAGGLLNCGNRDSGNLPNIVLAISDDQGRDHAGCYGDPVVRTPTLDGLAREGVRFTNAVCASPQCSPNRSALYTGKTPHTTGTEVLHSPLGGAEFIFTDALEQLGYRCCVWEKWHLGEAKQIEEPFDDLRANQPFFYQLGYVEPHRSWKHEKIYGTEGIRVPPYLPDTEAVREDLAGYLSDITWMDNHLGAFLKKLENEEIRGRTIVIFAGDNGLPFPRAKATLYDPGLLVPLIVSWPGLTRAGMVTDALVSFVDLAPTILSGLNLPIPEDMQGQNLLPLLAGRTDSVRDVVFAERNAHADEFVMRCARTHRYKYIRTFTNFPFLPVGDIANGASWQEIVRLRAAGELPRPLADIYNEDPVPAEELYDLENDPWEFTNLAGSPELATVKRDLKEKLKQWMVDTGDNSELIRLL